MSTAHAVIVLYASGDGGWFGAAKDMFHQIGNAGYYAVGFSSRALLKIARPQGRPATAEILAAEYEQILSHAKVDLHLDTATPAVLTGWSRGAAFAVLVGAEPAMSKEVIGVVAIGLDEDENLIAGGPDEETDEGPALPKQRSRALDTYALIADHLRVPCVVIQSTKDDYLPAVDARQRFGPDTADHRFFAVEAHNHRFAGGKDTFNATLASALRWIVSRTTGTLEGRED